MNQDERATDVVIGRIRVVQGDHARAERQDVLEAEAPVVGTLTSEVSERAARTRRRRPR